MLCTARRFFFGGGVFIVLWSIVYLSALSVQLQDLGIQRLSSQFLSEPIQWDFMGGVKRLFLQEDNVDQKVCVSRQSSFTALGCRQMVEVMRVTFGTADQGLIRLNFGGLATSQGWESVNVRAYFDTNWKQALKAAETEGSWCGQALHYSARNDTVHIPQPGLDFAVTQSARPRTWHAVLDLCGLKKKKNSLPDLAIAVQALHWQSPTGSVSWENAWDMWICASNILLFGALGLVSRVRSRRHLYHGSPRSDLPNPLMLDRLPRAFRFCSAHDLQWLAFILGFLCLAAAHFGFRADALAMIANICTSGAQVLVMQRVHKQYKQPWRKIDGWRLCSLSYGSVFVVFLAEWLWRKPPPHALSLLLSGGSDVAAPEHIYPYIFECCHLGVAIILCTSWSWCEDRRQLLLFLYIIALGYATPFAFIFSPWVRQRVRLVFALVRSLSLGCTQYAYDHLDERNYSKFRLYGSSIFTVGVSLSCAAAAYVIQSTKPWCCSCMSASICSAPREQKYHCDNSYPRQDRLASNVMWKNLESSVVCVGPEVNRTCKFQNLYYWVNSYFLFLLESTPVPKERLLLSDSSKYGQVFEPSIIRFNTRECLEAFVSSERFETLNNLTLIYAIPWHHNIGHALFDGLYPAFVGLAKFGLHASPFRSLVIMEPVSTRYMIEDILHAFSGLGVRLMTRIQRRTRGIRMEQAVLGSRNMGQRHLNREYALHGSRELGAVRLFRERMFATHGIPANCGLLQPANQSIGKILIIDNKRFTGMDRDMLASFKRVDGMEVEYINWASIALFKQQLEKLCTADVHVSSIGTSGIYQTFLHDGAVHVNLGFIENERQKPFPLFMEQYMAEGAPYLRALYYNSSKRLCGLQRHETEQLLGRAVSLARNGFHIPVAPGDNLSPEGRVFRDLCANGCDDLFMSMNPDPSNTQSFPGICTWDAWAEYVVYEQGGWHKKGFKGEHCPVNRNLLKKLKTGRDLANLSTHLDC